MKIILVLLGIVWIIAGVLLFIFTDASKEILRNLFKQKNMKALSIIALVIGVLLILGRTVVTAPWIPVVLGIMGVAKGLFFMFGPENKTKALIDWWLHASNSVIKSWGIVSFLVGVLLLLIL